jgi:hypothetical protein
MFMKNHTMKYLLIAGAAVIAALAFGFNLGFLMIVAICPLMMFFMMSSMGGMGRKSNNSDDRVDVPKQDEHSL